MTIFKQIVQNFKVKTILLNAVQTLFNSHVNKYQEVISGNRPSHLQRTVTLKTKPYETGRKRY